MRKLSKRISTVVISCVFALTLLFGNSGAMRAYADDPAPSPYSWWLFKNGTHDIIDFYVEYEKNTEYSNSANSVMEIWHANPDDLTGISYDAAKDLVVFNNVKLESYEKGNAIYSHMMVFRNCKGVYGKGNTEINSSPLNSTNFHCFNGYTQKFIIALDPGASLKFMYSPSEWDTFVLNDKLELGEGVQKERVTTTSEDYGPVEIYTFTRPIDVATLKNQATIAPATNEYSGSAITPTVTITGLTENTDFTVAYSNNTNVGEAKATVTGKGAYTGTLELKFNITPASITGKKADARLSATEFDHTGSAITPDVTITGLTKDTDYTVAYANNIEPGTATATITGKGNYKDSFTLEFTIKKAEEADQTEAKVEDKSGQDYTVKSDGEKKEATYEAPKSNKETSVKIPDKITLADGTKVPVTKVAPNACKKNKKLKSATIGNYVKDVGDNAFNGCSNLTTLKFGKRVENIGKGAARNCKKLKKANIPASTKKIGANAFNGDSSLTNLTINCKNLKSVGNGAIKKINPKATITLKGTAKQKKAVEKLITNKKTGYKSTMKIKK